MYTIVRGLASQKSCYSGTLFLYTYLFNVKWFCLHLVWYCDLCLNILFGRFIAVLLNVSFFNDTTSTVMSHHDQLCENRSQM